MTSNKIKLIRCDQHILETILKGDDFLAQLLNINVAENWSEFGAVIFKFILEKIKDDPTSKSWWTYLPIEIKTNTLIGSCGYKGPPDEAGMVEIGYEVAAAKRNLGYATEIVQLLVDHAFQHQDVHFIQAHTMAEENASVSVLRKSNFKFIEEIDDENEGKIWKWTLNR